MVPVHVLLGLHYPLAPLYEGPVIHVSRVNITMATEAQLKAETIYLISVLFSAIVVERATN